MEDGPQDSLYRGQSPLYGFYSLSAPHSLALRLPWAPFSPSVKVSLHGPTSDLE